MNNESTSQYKRVTTILPHINKTMMYEPVKRRTYFFLPQVKKFSFASGNSIHVPLPFIE